MFYLLMMGFVLQVIILIVYKRQILLKIHLLRQGLLLTRKSWAPVQSLDWLRFRWKLVRGDNLVRGTLELQKSQLEELFFFAHTIYTCKDF